MVFTSSLLGSKAAWKKGGKFACYILGKAFGGVAFFMWHTGGGAKQLALRNGSF